MIFVTVGTHQDPFDRLLDAVGRLDVDEEIVVQYGHSTSRPANAACVDFMPFDELRDHVARARVVVTHAGVGSMMLAMSEGRRPVVMPRREAHGEHVDDHQLELARRMGSADLATVVEEADELAVAVAGAGGATTALGTKPGLARDLSAYLAEVLDPA